jgi:hypothetical protein
VAAAALKSMNSFFPKSRGFVARGGRFVDDIDRLVVDGRASQLAMTLENLSHALRVLQNGAVQRYMWIVMLVLLLLVSGAPLWP